MLTPFGPLWSGSLSIGCSHSSLDISPYLFKVICLPMSLGALQGQEKSLISLYTPLASTQPTTQDQLKICWMNGYQTLHPMWWVYFLIQARPSSLSLLYLHVGVFSKVVLWHWRWFLPHTSFQLSFWWRASICELGRGIEQGGAQLTGPQEDGTHSLTRCTSVSTVIELATGYANG